jgi:hypothetical protein
VGDPVDPDQLVSASDIAHRLGLPRRQAVHWYLRNDDTFPEPVARVGNSGRRPVLIWYWPDVEAWAKDRWPEGRPTRRRR